MARARTRTSDNLGLLLDTMCNAFGGVIFIAMLLAILSQFAEVKTEAAADPVELKTLDSRRSRLVAELATLELAKNRQEETLKDLQSVQAVRDNLDRVNERNREQAETLERLREESQRLEEAEIRIEAARKLKEEIQLSSKGAVRKLDLPKLTYSGKFTMFFVVKWNRLFLLRLTTKDEPHGPFNLSDVEHKENRFPDGRALHEYNPIAGKGISLDDPAWESAAAVADVLRHVPSTRYSLHFAVYPDSYRGAGIVREFFRKKGYETNWYIMASQDEKLILQTGGRGAAPSIQE